MELGTWGEWFGACATAGATIVALYFGTRDQALAAERSAARKAIRDRASAEVRRLNGYLAGINRNMTRRADQGALEDDAMAAAYIADAGRLGPARRLIVRRVVAAIYGKSLVALAEIGPEPGPSVGLAHLMMETNPEVRAYVARQIKDEKWVPRTSSRYHLALVERVSARRVKRVRRLFAVLASV